MDNDVTEMLARLSEGDKEVVNRIFPLVYDELKKLAGNYLRKERSHHTLQPTALVHEAYLRLVDNTRISWQNRAHFLGMGATLMRQILIDHARKHRAEKRGGKDENLQLDETFAIVGENNSNERQIDLIALDDALKKLAEFDLQKSKIVEMRYFGGLTNEEAAEVLGVSEITVKRHWRLAKTWLAETING